MTDLIEEEQVHQEYPRTLTLEQRAQVCGEEGICPSCEREVEWANIDHTFYVCEDCMAEINSKDLDPDSHMAGYMDGMGDLLKSVLTEMVEKGDPSFSIIRKTIRDVESNKDVKLS